MQDWRKGRARASVSVMGEEIFWREMAWESSDRRVEWMRGEVVMWRRMVRRAEAVVSEPAVLQGEGND